jgi:hypothetical protein
LVLAPAAVVVSEKRYRCPVQIEGALPAVLAVARDRGEREIRIDFPDHAGRRSVGGEEILREGGVRIGLQPAE